MVQDLGFSRIVSAGGRDDFGSSGIGFNWFFSQDAGFA